ncbi:MAG: hypothetical protein OXE46_15895 [Chloroflexi bacterium]|nr:hypothetical protein [Chloroflexota bacterium]
MKLSDKSRQILKLIRDGRSYEQILSLHSDYTYKDIFSAAQEALELESPIDSTYQDRLENIRRKHANAYEPWTYQQEELLKKMHMGGAPLHAIASALKRQPSAIRGRIRKLSLDE